MALSLAEIASILEAFGPPLTDQQLLSVRRYIDLLVYWNEKINLTALTDPAEIVARHFGESIFGDTVVPMRSGRLADVGTGAGFPGIALKILNPALRLILIEPNRKKCAFLTEVCNALHLSEFEVCREQYETHRFESQSLDFLCSRALGHYSHLLRWARSVVRVGGNVVLWLGTEESIAVSRAPGWIWELPVQIPGSARRLIVVGRPMP